MSTQQIKLFDSPLWLDHVGYLGGSLEALQGTWQRLGFTTTPAQTLMRQNSHTGELVSLGQRSAHVVLPQGYIEFSELLSADPEHHLAPWLHRGTGLHILALGSDDVLAAHEATSALPLSATGTASRCIEYGTKHGAARFIWFMLQAEASPEGLLCVVQNLNPELVFQATVQTHPNGAQAVSEVVVYFEKPELSLGRYRSLLHMEPVQIEMDAWQFQLSRGVLTLCSSATLSRRFGLARFSPGFLPAPFFAALVIEVAELSVARECLQRAQVPFRETIAGLQISPLQATGTHLLLAQA